MGHPLWSIPRIALWKRILSWHELWAMRFFLAFGKPEQHPCLCCELLRICCKHMPLLLWVASFAPAPWLENVWRIYVFPSSSITLPRSKFFVSSTKSSKPNVSPFSLHSLIQPLERCWRDSGFCGCPKMWKWKPKPQDSSHGSLGLGWVHCWRFKIPWRFWAFPEHPGGNQVLLWLANQKLQGATSHRDQKTNRFNGQVQLRWFADITSNHSVPTPEDSRWIRFTGHHFEKPWCFLDSLSFTRWEMMTCRLSFSKRWCPFPWSCPGSCCGQDTPRSSWLEQWWSLLGSPWLKKFDGCL